MGLRTALAWMPITVALWAMFACSTPENRGVGDPGDPPGSGDPGETGSDGPSPSGSGDPTGPGGTPGAPGLDRIDGFVEVGPLAAGESFAVRYSLAAEAFRRVSVYVDDLDTDTLYFTPTGGPARHDQARLTVTRAGKVMLRVDPDDFAANDGQSASSVDRIFAPDPGTGGTEISVGNVVELADALKKAKPGDALVMKDGAWNNAKLVFAAQGEPEKPITLRPRTPGGVVLGGTSSLSIQGAYLAVSGLRFEKGALSSGEVIAFGEGSHHCRLTDTRIQDYNPGDIATRYHWIGLRGQQHRVDHCELSGQRHSGVTLVVWVGDKPDRHLIDHNLFADRPAGDGNGFESIRIGTSDVSMQDSLTTVEANLFEKVSGEIEAISNKSCGNVYRYNTFRDNESMLTLRHGNRCRVEGNFFLGYGAPGMGGVRIIGEDHLVVNNYFGGIQGAGMMASLTLMNGLANSPLSGYFAAHRAQVSYNTFVDCAHPMVIGYDKGDELSLQPKGVLLQSNVVKSKTAPLIAQAVPAANVTYQGNILFGAALGVSAAAGLREVDPLLVQSADGLFRPADQSPALDAAPATSVPVLIDLEGRLRDPKPDVGAIERSAGSPHVHPLARSEVGPTWR